MGKLLGIGAHGKVGLSVGGKLRCGRLHSSIPGEMTPVFVHLIVGGGVAIAPTVEGVDVTGQDPT